jgi:hypothetical protein
MKGRGTWLAIAAAVVGLALAGVRPAQAGLLPTLAGVSGPDGSGHYTFSYHLTVPAPVKVTSGSYFTIYDFAGYVAGSITAPMGWTPSVAMVTPPPSGVMPSADSPGIANLTWTYTGPDLLGFAIVPGFTAKSIYGSVYSPPDGYFNVASKSRTISTGAALHAVTNTDVPVAPEPATVAMLGLGLPVAGLFGWLRRRG